MAMCWKRMCGSKTRAHSRRPGRRFSVTTAANRGGLKTMRRSIRYLRPMRRVRCSNRAAPKTMICLSSAPAPCRSRKPSKPISNAVRSALYGTLASAALAFAVAADAQPRAAVPQLASTQSGWLADTEFLPPASGPGPVTFDRSHPYVRNNTQGQPTFRIADTGNPILQPWVAARMNADNREVLAGKFAFTARSSCWPAGVPGFLVFGCGARTVYFVQTPNEVLMINNGDQQVRHVYLNVPHSARVAPSWYGESVGYYENGDTLVVDTIGLNDRTYVDNY